jgi:hypothetical protein
MVKMQRKGGVKDVYCRYIRKGGKIYFPKKGKVFHFQVKA